VSVLSGTLDLTDSTVLTSTDSAVALSGNTIAALAGLSIDGAGAYGVSCDGGSADPGVSLVTLDPCTADVLNATLGEFELFNGCEIDQVCEVPAD